jgi:voltage-gated potassium channel
LTTVGYGDMAPITTLGRIVAGCVMICGIILFGLLAGILASGFSAEVRREEFLRNWSIVASVPMFHQLGAGTIGDLAAVLRPREMPANVVVTRKGSPGSSMYFIVSGGVKVELAAGFARLGPGHFFGERALLTGERRNATVVTVADTVLLELDIADLRMLASSHPELTSLIEDAALQRSG